VSFPIFSYETSKPLLEKERRKIGNFCFQFQRRSFICFALSSGIPPQVVMKWTGHSDYQAMKPYIDIAEKTKANAMKLFEQEMEK
jgi:hypothetical protein